MKKKGMHLLLLFMVFAFGFLLKATPAQAAYVECSSETDTRTKAGSYYIWIDLEEQAIMYSTSKTGTGKVLVEAEPGNELGDYCITDGKTVFFLEFGYSGGSWSYIYKYSIAKGKKTLLKKTNGVYYLTAYYSKKLYMMQESKFVSLNVSTGKMTKVLSNVSTVYGMNKRYVVYGKTSSSGKATLYSYDMTSKKKTKIKTLEHLAIVTVANGKVYYLDKTKSGTEANKYVNTYVFRSCSLSGKSGKTLSGELQGTSASMEGSDSISMHFIIWNTGDGGDGTDGYYTYTFSSGVLIKES